jgi:hypothetical protein
MKAIADCRIRLQEFLEPAQRYSSTTLMARSLPRCPDLVHESAHGMRRSHVQPMAFSGVCGANHGGRSMHDFLHDEQRIQMPPLSV